MKFKVGVHFEEGTVLSIEADSPEQAKKKAEQILDDFAGASYPDEYRADPVHRDYMVASVMAESEFDGW